MKLPSPGRRVLPPRAFGLLLLAAVGFGCGSPASEEDLVAFSEIGALASEEARGAPPAVGTCRRWTTCVPQNPCHTGWVTGCRANVPICTDVGGWLSNGTACGDGAVCYMGDCTPCPAGERCDPVDAWGNPLACHAGAISCATGQPACVDAGASPDGTACWPGSEPWYVCTAGECGYCPWGTSCQPAGAPCHVGTVTCSSGQSCEDTGVPVPDGAWCGDGRTCLGGECLACAAGASCTPDGMPCWNGFTDCSTGTPHCVPSWPLPEGQGCGGGLVCDPFGACVPPCQGGVGCVPPQNSCLSGVTVCVTATTSYCQEGPPAADGTACGDQATCFSGSCVPCGAAACASPDGCHTSGQVSCASGVCEPTGEPLPDGASCGVAGESCQAGACTGVAGAAIIVRTASGYADLTGTRWRRCDANEPTPGRSLLKTDDFQPTGFVHVEDEFVTLDCSGEPVSHVEFPVTVLLAGDRRVGWTSVPPPDGLPAEVIATAVRVAGMDPVTGETFEFQNLLFVNDWAWPRGLFDAENDRAIAADGYPTLLTDRGKPEDVPVCVPMEPCPPPESWCTFWMPTCMGEFLMCMPMGPEPDGVPCPGGFCIGGACTAVPEVTGTRTVTHWTDAGPLAGFVPNDLGAIGAWWPDASGIYFPGSIHPDGSFTIPGLRPERYVLAFNRGAPFFVETDARTLDLGEDLIGRPGLVTPWGYTPVTFSLDGLAPFATGDHVTLLCGNTGMAAAPLRTPATIPVGATTYTAVIDWAGKPWLDAALDTAYVFQTSSSTLPGTTSSWKALSRWGQVPPTSIAEGMPAPSLGAVLGEPTSTGSLSLHWPMASWDARLAEINPAAAAPLNWLAVIVKPWTIPAIGPNSTPLLPPSAEQAAIVRLPGIRGDLDIASVSWGRFLPAHWAEYREVRLEASIPIALPDRPTISRNAPAIVRYDPIVAGLPDPPAELVVTPPLAPMIRVGDTLMDAFAPQWFVGTGPSFSWSPPAVGVPTSYTVAIFQPSASTPTTFALVAVAVTPSTSFRFPDGTLSPGQAYIAVITARSSETERLDAPLRMQFDADFATAVTAGFTP